MKKTKIQVKKRKGYPERGIPKSTKGESVVRIDGELRSDEKKN